MSRPSKHFHLSSRPMMCVWVQQEAGDALWLCFAGGWRIYVCVCKGREKSTPQGGTHQKYFLRCPHKFLFQNIPPPWENHVETPWLTYWETSWLTPWLTLRMTLSGYDVNHVENHMYLPRVSHWSPCRLLKGCPSELCMQGQGVWGFSDFIECD